MGWDRGTVRFNLQALLSNTGLIVTDYDKFSIMHYKLPANLFTKRENSPCYLATENNEISTGDANLIAKLYPTTTENGLARENNLVDRYAAALKDAGVPDQKVKELTNAIRQEIAVNGTVNGNVVTQSGSQTSNAKCSPNIQGVGGGVQIKIEGCN